MKKSDFENIIRISGTPNYVASAFSPWQWPAQPRCSSRVFYRFLGFQKYNCVDLNQEHGAVSLDLNHPLQDSSLFSQFDLVTDHGCNEHVFNTGEAYRTMHRLCKPGGIILIDQSVWEGNGYYLYDLSFFEGLAAANSYKIIYSGYVVTFRERTSDGSNIQYPIKGRFFPSNKNTTGICSASFLIPLVGHMCLSTQLHWIVSGPRNC
ncbi:MAG: hypothetical protein HYZ52_02840 [Candidatus Omnitrophica bacterium]|nr:hypothetical protein [Candidatus Omnitrophota bacterium]